MVSERTILKSYTKSLDHLGIIAALVAELGIVELVNARLPKLRHHTLTHGDVVLALILNGLGFTHRRLYLFAGWFQNKPLERLFRKEVTAADFTDDVIGRTLDAIKEYGPELLYQEIISQIYLTIQFGSHRVHLDTTNFSVYGDYATPEAGATIRITKGYPKDGRWELNRFGLGLVVNQVGVPLFMKLLPGNNDDKTSLPEMLTQFRSQVVFPDPLYCIADSAFYTEKSLTRIDRKVYFITLVPGTVGEQQALLRQDLPFTPMADPRYSFCETESEYAGVHQKWVVYRSAEGHKKEEKTLEKNRLKEDKKVRRALTQLNKREFACEKDARTEAELWIQTFPHYEFESVSIVTQQKRISGRRGRPKKDEVTETVYSLAASIRPNEVAWAAEQAILGRFVLATNDLDISPENLLAQYKSQDVVERAFRFLKDSSFAISDVFLKKIGRIEALGMMMVLMLAVYSIGEQQLRKRLAERGATVLNQVGKPTAKPTLRWVLTFFDGVAESYRYDPATDTVRCEGILNMTQQCWDIVEIFGPVCERYYA